MNQLTVGRTDSVESTSIEKTKLLNDKTLIEKLRAKITYQMMMEYGLATMLISFAFVFSTLHFLNESVKTLVPFSSISSCSSSSEVFSLVPQTVTVNYPATIIIIDYYTGLVYPGYTNATFLAEWSSCLLESVDNNFGIESQTNTYYQPVTLNANFNGSIAVNGSSSTNNECFQLFCGVEFSYVTTPNPLKNYEQFLTDSIFLAIPYNSNVDIQDVNGTKTLVNNQLITSISGTNNSVTASCAVSVGGYYLQVFTQSNSVTSTGTYLCTQKTSELQALSSGLSIALTALGFCRLYFLGKSYIKHL